jgi:itaconyl-CoA hydratase
MTPFGPYLEDFQPGDIVRHGRGKTLTSVETTTLTHLSMNTSDGHFDAHRYSKTAWRGTMVFGGITAAVVIGLSMEDTAACAIRELGVNDVRLSAPVADGDTLYAYTEVRSIVERDANSGEVTFHHTGVNQRDEVVFTCERRVLVRRRPPGLPEAGG